MEQGNASADSAERVPFAMLLLVVVAASEGVLYGLRHLLHCARQTALVLLLLLLLLVSLLSHRSSTPFVCERGVPRRPYFVPEGPPPFTALDAGGTS